MVQFRQYISNTFADQLQGMINDVRGDKRTARPKTVEDLPLWPSVLRMFEGRAVGSDLRGCQGTAWSAYQAITEYISHESGRAKDRTDSARRRFESLYWGQASTTIAKAHQEALAI